MKPIFFFWVGLLCVFQTSYAQTTTQICKPALSIYFPHDEHRIVRKAYSELETFVSKLEGKSVTVEILAHTDNRGTDDYNFRLSQQRAASVERFLRMQNVNLADVNLVCKGEFNPKHANTNEHNRALNRRVDIVAFITENGRITIAGDQGSQVLVKRDFFGPCSICESETEMEEVLSADAAEAINLPLLTTDGTELITGGMIRFNRKCEQLNDSDCVSATIRMPNPNKMDTSLRVWVSVTDSLGRIRWEETEKKCGCMNDYYELTIDCFGRESISGMQWINCDKPKCRVAITYPPLLRNGETGSPDTKEEGFQLSDCPANSFMATDKGVDKHGIIYELDGDCFDYRSDDCEYPFCFAPPLSAYQKSLVFSDTTFVLKVPKRLRNQVALSISPADTLLNGAVKGRSHKKRFKAPKHPWAVHINQGDEGIDFNRNSKHLKTRNRRGRKVVKMKLRRSALKNLNV